MSACPRSSRAPAPKHPFYHLLPFKNLQTVPPLLDSKTLQARDWACSRLPRRAGLAGVAAGRVGRRPCTWCAVLGCGLTPSLCGRSRSSFASAPKPPAPARHRQTELPPRLRVPLRQRCPRHRLGWTLPWSPFHVLICKAGHNRLRERRHLPAPQ